MFRLYGSYEALKGGHVADSLTDFTGGLTETYKLKSGKVPRNIINIMFKALERQSVIGAGIQVNKQRNSVGRFYGIRVREYFKVNKRVRNHHPIRTRISKPLKKNLKNCFFSC